MKYWILRISLDSLKMVEFTNYPRCKMDGYLATNVAQLRRMIAELIYKVEYGKDSTSDDLSEALDKMEF